MGHECTCSRSADVGRGVLARLTKVCHCWKGGVIKFKLPPVESPLDDATDVVPRAQTGTLPGEAAHPMQSSDSSDALLQTQLQSSSRRGPGRLLPLLLTTLQYNYGSSDGLEGQEKSFASHFSLDSPLKAERRRGYEFLPAPQ